MGKDEMKPNGKRREREREKRNKRIRKPKKGDPYARLSKAEKKIKPHRWDRTTKKFE